MSTDHKSLNKAFAAFSFLTALILYVLTLPPTASFWDCSERIACAYGLQIPHPPGTPFYLILGRIFSMFAGPTSAAYMINLMSALASATTIMLLYLIIVRFVRDFRGYDVNQYSLIDRVGLYGSALIGALTFAVTDSHWFTSIEAETYALSLTFTAAVVWLILKWSENHDNPRNERWILLITFLFGLAFGVHLLSLLAIFFVGLIIYFRKYDFKLRTFLIANGITVIIFFLIYPLTIIQLPALAGSFALATAGMLGPLVFLIIFAGIIIYGIHFTHKKNHRTANILLVGYLLILIGYSTFSMIYIRSQVNPGIDQNSPDNVDAFISYLKREQYGQQPLLRGASFSNETGSIDRDNEKFFPRRHSPEPRHQQKYAQYNSDIHFFLSYQVSHMYLRYFAWNFIGRDSDIQDASWISGFGGASNYKDNPAHNRFFFLPFLLGLTGMIFHFSRDWKRATSVLVLFLATGLAIVLYLNQTPFQPRERDYSYTGSFFAWSIWIGLGANGIIELVKQYFKENKFVAVGALVAMTLAVPVLVGSQTYSNNDRSLRYVAPDYAYNLLNSTAPYAILFTNGDNDTFPLWYLQEVEQIRTDVRVVNLSLLNTEWYIKQIKNKWNHNSPPVPINITDEEVDRLNEKYNFRRPSDFHEAGEISIPVDKNFLQRVYAGEENFPWAPHEVPEEMRFTIPINELDDNVSWEFEGMFLGRDQQGNDLHYTRIQDDMVLEILRTNRWVRPVYFSTTVARDSQMDLQDYFSLEGKAFRVVPYRTHGEIDPGIHGKRLQTFRLREINNEKAYFDQNIRRMMDNYRTIINRQVSEYMQIGEPDSAAYWLNWAEERIPFTTIEGDPTSILNFAYRYAQLDHFDRALDLVELARVDLDRSFENYLLEIDRIESRIDHNELLLEERGTIDRRRRREIQQKISSLRSERQQLVRELSFDSSRYMIIQRIYYMNDMESEASDIANFIADISDQRLPFPSSREENLEQMNRIYRE
ncbi:MAG: DUF2723 domain-containing protein [Balneolales bacterium]